jgi:hypothetical protein
MRNTVAYYKPENKSRAMRFAQMIREENVQYVISVGTLINYVKFKGQLSRKYLQEDGGFYHVDYIEE